MEINDKLAQRLGLQTLDELKTALKERLSQEYSQVARQRLKRNLLDALADKVSFEVPSGMVNDEFKAIWNAMKTPPNPPHGEPGHVHHEGDEHGHDHDREVAAPQTPEEVKEQEAIAAAAAAFVARTLLCGGIRSGGKWCPSTCS